MAVHRRPATVPTRVRPGPALFALSALFALFALFALCRRVRARTSTVATALVGPEFTLGELQQVDETVLGERLDRAGFRRKVLSTPGFVVATGTRRPGSAGGPPAARYRAGAAPRDRSRGRSPSAPRSSRSSPHAGWPGSGDPGRSAHAR